VQLTAKEKHTKRQAYARDIIAALTNLAGSRIGVDYNELRALTIRIWQCNRPDNQWIVPNATNAQGQPFEARGQFWQCGSKLCPNCLARQSRKNRKKLREALDRQVLARGERYYFPTLTIDNPGISLARTRKLVDRAWTLFRKRSLWRDLVKGCVKSEEFTVTATGYHYHLHLLIRSRFLLYSEFRRVWSECVKIAADENEVNLKPMDESGHFWVKFQPISNMKNIPLELCKYITKSDSWLKIPPNDLEEIALIRQWFRMFEMLGTFAERSERSERTPIVHTRSLSDGGSDAVADHYWRDRVHQMDFSSFKHELSMEITQTREIRLKQLRRRYENAIIIDGNGEILD